MVELGLFASYESSNVAYVSKIDASVRFVLA